MVAPLVIGAALAGGGLAGSLLSKKRKMSVDAGALNDIINRSGEEQRKIIGGLRPGLDTNLSQFQTSGNKAKTEFQDRSRASASDFLKNYDPITSKILAERTNQLKQDTFGVLPEAVQAAREAGAAGGGLNRGSVNAALANIPINAARDFSRGAAELGTTTLNQQLGARQSVFNADQTNNLKLLGFDEDTINKILDTQDEGLINELNVLAGEASSRGNALLGVEQLRQGVGNQNAMADNAREDAIFNALISGGGAIAGSGGKAPTAGGATAVQSLATQFPQGSQSSDPFAAYIAEQKRRAMYQPAGKPSLTYQG